MHQPAPALLTLLHAHGFETMASELAHLRTPEAVIAEVQAEADFLRRFGESAFDADLLESLLTVG